ncbi:MAG: hypothetical protein MUC96_03755 [Myxococcaceae bacterium]|jgi:hypothetical protein|nr:hypothetical protein [Myxococcaceae bacterium]
MRPALLLLPLVAATSALAEPLQVFTGVHVVDLRTVDVKEQSFQADFYVWMRFKAEGLDEARLAQVMSLEPVNGRFESKEVIDDKLVGDQKYVCWRVVGTFFFLPDLKQYPFDEQVLPLVLESTSLEADEVMLVDDRDSYARGGTPEARWGLAPSVVLPEFTLHKVERQVFEGVYPTNFGDPSKQRAATRYSRFALRVSFVRDAWSYTFKILIPLLIILAMAWLVFFLPVDQLDTNASVSMTALLSCMAYNVAVSSNMPDIGYLVLSDQLFMGTYVLLLFSLGYNFFVFALDARDEKDRALRLAKLGRFVFPALVASLLALFIARV